MDVTLSPRRGVGALLLGALLAVAGSAAAAPAADLSGLKRVGTASFYADRFAGRPMADGTPMDPQGSNAASRTLPLGTVARVTNLQTGLSAIVRIRDRGPYRGGRIIDLSPGTARSIGLTPSQGRAKVEVAPILVPLPEGGLMLGEAAREGGAALARAGR